MKIIVDTNVLISAILRDRDPELIIQFIVDHPDFEWVASPEVLAEYQAVLARPKFRLSQEIQATWTTLLTATISPIQVNVTVDFPIDPKDAMFLSCAIATDADFIITGDTDLLNADLAIKTSVVNVSTFKMAFYEAQADC
ncbi:putative toxin-antitoxin system toxin component, PIN family [Leptolyngbya iicbica]|uniref:Putative toxin-antitoxin system toxin component, PIN family n=1 Tax=Leptolyngbya iicbica LK TaxID=2294035 RepID=A0A4Q7E9W9_9CYAN|nr:putative toxin-antitoxin system toxin component, PIN family [Leptolyngbya sp. LK]RZM79677.1 putative toxin-antitoxin system toxin component, PIN family [Leptolyngbya sp. LK]